MYNAFFEFGESPFASRPNLAFFYPGQAHDAALRSLSFAVQARMGLASLTGEPGTGKTMVLECLRDTLEAVQIQCAFVRDSRISANHLFQTIASELDLRCQGTSADQISSALNQFTIHQAKKGRTVALIIDEAHNLSADVLDQIVRLASQHDNKTKLLQTVLAGNPELNITLDGLNLEPLKQHSVLSCALEPFSSRETQDYIEFRLAQAGMREQTFFPPDVMAEIYHRSRGFAPAIHALCDGLLSAAFLVESKICTQEILDQVFNPTSGEASDTVSLAAVSGMDLTLLDSLSEPEPPAMKLTLLRLIFNILPSLPTYFAFSGSGFCEPDTRVLDPMLPASEVFLRGAELVAASSKLMTLTPKRKRRVARKAAVVPVLGKDLAEPIDFANVAVKPAQSVFELAPKLAPKGTTKLVPLTCTAQAVPGTYAYALPESVSMEISLRPTVSFGSATIAGEITLDLGDLEKCGPLPLTCDAAPVPPAAWTSTKTRLTSLQSLQPLGPQMDLELVNVRMHSLLQPEWTAAETASAQAGFIVDKKPFSFAPKWAAAGVVMILAGLALYGGGAPALSTTASAMNHGWQRVHEAVLDRAAVALDEDFRAGLENWTNRGGGHPSWTSDASGFVHPAGLALYRPSLGLVDYQMQFVGTIDKKSLSWVVRAADANNYYAVGLTVLKPGAVPVIGVTRYAVVNGKIQDRVTTPLLLSARVDTVYHVSLDVQGDDFALSVQDQPVDSWTDTKLRHGGIGFFSEADAGSRIAGVQVRSKYDMLGRLCALLLPAGGSSDRTESNERAAN